MKPHLSQDEIDTLLNQGDSVDGNEACKPINFGTDDKIIRGSIPFMDALSETLARNLQRKLNAEHAFNATITASEVENIKMGDYLKTMNFPSSLNIIKLPPIPGQALVTLEAKLIYDLLNQQFGGNMERNYKIEGKTFTLVEQQFINNLLEHIYFELQEAWSTIYDVKVEHQYAEMNPKHANIISPSEQVILCKIKISADNKGGNVDIAIPYSTLNPILPELEQRFHEFQGRNQVSWEPMMMKEAQRVSLNLHSILVRDLVPLKTIKDIDVGTIIGFEKPDEVILNSGNVPIARCAYGKNDKGQLCVKVIETLELPTEEDLQYVR